MSSFSDFVSGANKSKPVPIYQPGDFTPDKMNLHTAYYPQYLLVNIAPQLEDLSNACMGIEAVDVLCAINMTCCVYGASNDTFYSLSDEVINDNVYVSLYNGLTASGYKVAGETTEETASRMFFEIINKTNSLAMEIDAYLTSIGCPIIEGVGSLYACEMIDKFGNLVFKMRTSQDILNL